ncbi:MAG: DUF3300 domain-containing protein [Candidatus Omnitrophota bacterium]|nr:DUF3300 domain-containing protein [Candidatus Omnitrophota bacterium]
MKKERNLKRAMLFVFLSLLVLPFAARAQEYTDTMPAENIEQAFRPEELDQMLAPIALYPDALLAQVLTAATYPLDIVSASRFIKDNSGLKEQALIDAAIDRDWEPSVKALLQFPDVLIMMDSQLEWTTKLGNAFLAQQRDVMDSVQRLRQKAYAQGNLKSGKEQAVKVDTETKIIVIESAEPKIVYVPVYDPGVIYGTWWYPDYPPYYCYYPGYIRGPFLRGYYVNAWWGWGSFFCDWRFHGVFIHVSNFNVFVVKNFRHVNRFHVDRGKKYDAWHHDSRYRRGVKYRDSITAQRFEGRRVSRSSERAEAASEFRGRAQVQSGPSDRISGAGTAVGARPSEQMRGSSGRGRQSREIPRVELRGRDRAQVSERPRQATGSLSRGAQLQEAARPVISGRGRENVNVFSGVGRGGSERAASFRGQSSTQEIRVRGGSGRSRQGDDGSRGGGGSRSDSRQDRRGEDRRDNRR